MPSRTSVRHGVMSIRTCVRHGVMSSGKIQPVAFPNVVTYAFPDVVTY